MNSFMPLSYGQEALWFIYRNAPDSAAYNMGLPLKFEGDIDTNALREAVCQLVDYHAMLRVFFGEQDGIPYQYFKDNTEGYDCWQVVDAQCWSDSDLKEKLYQFSQIPFDLHKSVFRVTLFNRTSSGSVLLFSLHHIAGDAASLALLAQQLVKLYVSELEKQASLVSPLAADFGDYVVWEKELLQGKKGQQMTNYWLEQLAGEIPILKLPTDYSRPKIKTFNGGSHSVELPLELTKQLQASAKTEKSSLFNILLATYQVWLNYYSGQSDIWVGVPTSTPRNQPQFANMVGYLANPMIIRTEFPEDESLTFGQVIQQVSRKTLAGLYHQPYPFSLLVDQLHPPRDPSFSLLVQVLFRFEQSDLIPRSFSVDSQSVKRLDISQMEGQFDLSLTVIQEESLTLLFNYNTDLFADTTLQKMAAHFLDMLTAFLGQPQACIKQLPIFDQKKKQSLFPYLQTQKNHLAIAANFTSEPIEDSLSLWSQYLGQEHSFDFAPYNQIFQQLLNTSGLFFSKNKGLNVLLIRLQEWGKEVNRNVSDLITTLVAATNYTTRQFLLCFCPATPNISIAEQEALEAIEASLVEQLTGHAGIYIVTTGELKTYYPVSDFYDVKGDQLGNIPYTSLFFAALGTRIMRMQHRLQRAPYKVIVLDCDNTLWQGICGEDGPLGISITPGHAALQNFMLSCHQQGILLCLCSKNNEVDVKQVFDYHPDMPLQWQHIVDYRINWQAKSANIRSLAETLDLGLDSFIFLDDNPMECAEVEKHLPQVLTLQLPENSQDFDKFLRHVWAFDTLNATEEDRRRTTFYQANVQRDRLRHSTLTLDNFINELELKVAIDFMSSEQLPRVAQLTQRTNQFNSTTLRFSEKDIENHLQKNNGYCLVVDVGDRFGNYGLVGVVLYHFNNEVLFVEDILLSCRVLGRKVEHRLLSYLGDVAKQQNLEYVEVTYLATSKNSLVWDFLSSLVTEKVVEVNGGYDFIFTVDQCIQVEEIKKQVTEESQYVTLPEGQKKIINQHQLQLFKQIATTLATPEQVLSKLEQDDSKLVVSDDYQTQTEMFLATIWQGVLRTTVKPNDDFFKIGGNSLKAVQLASRLQDNLGVDVSLSLLFEYPVLKDLAAWLDNQQRGKTLPPIIPVPVNAVPVLSFAQQRLWFLAQLEGQTNIYNVFFASRLMGELDIDALRRVFQTLVLRHEALRQCFPSVVGIAAVRQLPAYDPLTVIDLSHLDANAQQLEVQRLADVDVSAPFDIAHGPLLRLNLLTLGQSEHVLLFNMHHIISDGWSMRVLIREWTSLYRAYYHGLEHSLSALPIQYSDYAAWQRQWLQGNVLDVQHNYWAEQLAGIPALLALPTDFPRPAEQDYRGAQIVTTLEAGLVQQLKQLSQEHGCTLYMTLLAAFQTLLHRYSGQHDLCVGSPIANRTHAQTEGLIGFFVNTLVLRAQFQQDMRFTDVLQQVRHTTLGAYSHQDIPFEQLVEQLNPERSLSYSPLFQVMFVLQNNDAVDLDMPNLTVAPLAVTYPVAKFDLTLSMQDAGEGLECHWEYATALFRADTITRMAQHFGVLLHGIGTQPTARLDTLPLITAAEQQQLQAWNNTATDYPQDQTITSLFEAQVVRTPDNIAVVFGDASLTYTELNARANQLAHSLIGRGVVADTLVGICVERSLEMVIGLLAILKAGGAYVPLDPSYPAERLAFMVQDSQVALLLTQTHLQGSLPITDLNPQPLLVCVDDPHLAAGQPVDNPPPRSQPQDLAYVIYTSGSTGKPKGVCITQHSVIRLVKNTNYLELNSEQVFLQYAPIAFDAATFEIWGALLNSARLIVTPPSYKELGQLGQLLQQEQVSILWLTSSLFNVMIDEYPHSLRGVKYLLAGGEVLSTSHVEKAIRLLPDTHLINGYGPTENTTFTCCYPIPPQTFHQSIPIGKPISNTKVFVLDKYDQPLPIGYIGELVTSGAGLARGYLNRPELTAEKFVEVELFGQVERIYRTGDLARWLPDGNLEYLGRIDHQVKLRGFRIELGEIEAVLAQHPAVSTAAVVLHEREGNKSLAAYVVGAASVDPAALRSWVAEQLPDYMIPASFTVLERMPLTPNGKVDRQALPQPDGLAGLGLNTADMGLRTPTEQLLATLWAGVLKLEAVALSADAQFFALGGHSLLATQLAARVRTAFAVELPLRVVFAEATLGAMAAWLDTQQREVAVPAISPLPAGAVPPLSFAQQRLWFLSQLEGQSATYNMPAALQLRGRLEVAALRHALQTLVVRHASLRQCFPVVDGVAVVAELPAYDPLQVVDLRHLPATAQHTEVQQRADAEATAAFNLATGALFRAQLLVLAADSHVLLVNMHHIVSDGWSIGVLLREWNALYREALSGIPANLPALPVQYGDYAAWQRQWLQGDVLAQQRTYWADQLAGLPALLELPTDFPRPAVQDYRGGHLTTTLDAELAAGLQALAQAQGCTLFMLLLAAFQTLLHRYSQQDDVCVGSPIANRTQAQTEGLVGFFVNTLVLRAQFTPELRFTELLSQVRHTALGAYAHQDIPFEQLVEQLNPTRSLSHSPLFQVMLVLQNNAAVDLDWPEVQVTALPAAYPVAKFDLTLSVAETPEGLTCHWEYATALFREDTIRHMAGHLGVLLHAIVAQPDAALHSLPLLTTAEQQQLQAWNATATAYPQDQTIVSLFEAQVTRTPNNTAVVFEDQSLTYAALNARANQLAHVLISQGVTADTLVGICVERSLEMVIGLLAILKAGGAYVPLDPAYPAERLAFMLQDSQVAVLLTQTHLQGSLSITDLNPQPLLVAVDDPHLAAGQPEDNPPPRSLPQDLAYVIYTSGSTGRPKGVKVENRNVMAFLFAYTQAAPVSGFIAGSSICPFSFDVFVWECFSTLCFGHSLYVISAETIMETEKLAEYLQQHQIAQSYLPPALLNAVATQFELKGRIPLQRLLVGVEPIEERVLQRFRNLSASLFIINGYGPTEATVCATFYNFIADSSLSRNTPIGRPLANYRIYLCDAKGQVVPVGVVGELCIAGAGLARGYLNRPELTAEKFVEVELFGQVERIYRTGDLARWLPDGNLEYLGRIDHQVKLRGFRIELGEIEAVLAQHPAVSAAAVVLHEREGNKSLAAYVAGESIDIAILRTWLAEQLPDYMVPASFTVLDRLPLTPNGKVNRKTLPEPDEVMAASRYERPDSDIEQQLADIWAAVIKRTSIGRHDNFFELGGHSLLATQVISRLRQTFQMDIALSQVFKHPTLAGLAAYIESLLSTHAMIWTDEEAMEDEEMGSL